MKRVANSYSAKSISAVNYAPVTTVRYHWWIPRIPNYVWLAMIILTLTALSISTFVRSQQQEREAKASYSYIKTQVENARSVNRQIREQTEQIRNNSRVAAHVAQTQLHLVRPNEIVIAVK